MHASLANLSSRPLIALLAFAAWALILAASILLVRTTLVLLGKKRANEFPSGIQHGGDVYWRLNRAHVNTLENLPIFAAIVLAGAALGVSSPTLARLAEAIVVARVLQSSFHLLSGRSLVVILRATSFTVQLAGMSFMIVETIRLCLP